MVHHQKPLRPDLVSLCSAAGLKKSGTVAALKTVLVQHFGAELDKEFAAATQHDDQVAPKEPPPLPPPVPPPPVLAPEEPPATTGDAVPACSEGQDGHAGGESAPCVFGRQSFEINVEGGEDNTAFFTDATQGPVLKEVSRESQSELLQAGVEGVIPVAVFVKVLEGFQAVQEGENQVAFLLAGSGVPKKIV